MNHTDKRHMQAATIPEPIRAAATSSPVRVDEEDLINWDYALETVPAPRRSGRIEVTLRKITISPPTVDFD
jgi:hypothetical protein